MTKLYFKIYLKNIAFLFGCAIFFASCEEDQSKLRNFTDMSDKPSQVIINAQFLQRDSGMIKLKGAAKLVEKYELVDSPYIVANKGIHIEFFDKKDPKNPGTIDADSALMNEVSNSYQAYGNVRIKTNDGKTFATNSIFWDSKDKLLKTNDTVFVTDSDGTTLISTEGMTAKDDFSEYTFKNNSGKFSTQKIPQ